MWRVPHIAQGSTSLTYLQAKGVPFRTLPYLAGQIVSTSDLPRFRPRGWTLRRPFSLNLLVPGSLVGFWVRLLLIMGDHVVVVVGVADNRSTVSYVTE